MAQMRLRRGASCTYFFEGEGYREINNGEVVDLTDNQMQAWADRFEPVSATPQASDSEDDFDGIEDNDDNDDIDDEDDDDGDDDDENQLQLEGEANDDGTNGDDKPDEQQGEGKGIGGELPPGDPNESPIAKRRRDRAARKKAREEKKAKGKK